MKALKKIYRITVSRYNFNELCVTHTKDVETEELTKEDDLLLFLDECDKKHPHLKDFGTTIQVETIYMVINV